MVVASNHLLHTECDLCIIFNHLVINYSAEMVHASVWMVAHVLRTSLLVNVMQMHSKTLKRQLVFNIAPLSHVNIDFSYLQCDFDAVVH